MRCRGLREEFARPSVAQQSSRKILLLAVEEKRLVKPIDAEKGGPGDGNTSPLHIGNGPALAVSTVMRRNIALPPTRNHRPRTK